MKVSFWSMLQAQSRKALAKGALVAIATVALLVMNLALPQSASAYPFWAQQNYETPREATGRIVCANCHLAAKPIDVEVPQAVLPDTVFKAIVKVPYDYSAQQVLAGGDKGGLNIGAVVMLPDGFKVAPDDRIPEEMKEELSPSYLFSPYSDTKQNVVIFGPIPGDQYKEVVIPVLAPDPRSDKSVNFGKYQIHVGGNRGRGQVYPTGEKSNNAIYNASAAGTISNVTKGEDGSYQVTIQAEKGGEVVDTIPAGPELIVAKGDSVTAGQAITNNPNVGGFGQKDVEIVLQSSSRVAGMIAFLAAVTLSQIMLVLKKKQVEKVQAAEMNF